MKFAKPKFMKKGEKKKAKKKDNFSDTMTEGMSEFGMTIRSDMPSEDMMLDGEEQLGEIEGDLGDT